MQESISPNENINESKYWTLESPVANHYFRDSNPIIVTAKVDYNKKDIIYSDY